MSKTVILFFDPDNTNRDAAKQYAEDVKVKTGANSMAVNFFSSSMDDLALVSKHRIVALPTVVVLDKNKVVGRFLSLIDIDVLADVISKED